MKNTDLWQFVFLNNVFLMMIDQAGGDWNISYKKFMPTGENGGKMRVAGGTRSESGSTL